MDSGERCQLGPNSRVQRGDGPRVFVFCLTIQPGIKRLTGTFDGMRVEAIASMDGINIGMMEFTAGTVAVVPFLQHKLRNIDIITTLAETVCPPPASMFLQ